MSTGDSIGDDVIFRCDGVLYDAFTLHRLNTPEPSRPVIYLTKDKQQAFLLTVDTYGLMHVEAIESATLSKLCHEFHLQIPSPHPNRNKR